MNARPSTALPGNLDTTKEADPHAYLDTRPRQTQQQPQLTPPPMEAGSYGLPPTQGSELGQALYDRAVRALRDRTLFEHTVSVGCQVSTPTGIRREGEKITIAGLNHDWQKLAWLVDRGVIVRCSAEVLAERLPAGKGATHRAVRCITVNGRIVPPGGGLSAADLATPDEPGAPEVAGRVDVNGMVMAGKVGFPARKGSDGRKELQALVQRGLVRAITAADRDDSGPQAA